MRVAMSLACAALAVACGASEAHPVEPEATATAKTSAEVAELEISGTGVDRFTSCPPPGELGQDWIPPVPPWTPGTPSSSVEGPATPPPDDATMHGSTPTERAIADTHEAFRACWHHSLIYDPTQDGHVAIVLRVGGDGRVAKVESYGACSISGEAIRCMKDTAKKLRFRPPAGGSDTILLPAVFTSSDIARHTQPARGGAYGAAAYIAVEALRPAFHACEESARRAGAPVASATFSLDIDSHGKVVHSHIDPWTGDRDLLVCAAAAFESGSFPAPPGGRGTVLARVAFNPRAGTD
jgi:hypothetical protein